MRRIAVLSTLVLTGGLLGPSTALATESGGPHVNRWIGVEDHFAIVLPNGETITDDEEPPAEEEDFLPPVGSQFFLSEVLYEAKDGHERGDEVGRTHVECTAQVAPVHFRCEISFVLHSGSQLHGAAVVEFGPEETSEPFQLDIAVTGGTGDFFGATGVVSLLDTTDHEDPEAETTTLYEADIELAHHD